jgi:hypothetical protein
MKTHFITFGNEPWKASVTRLCKEAELIGLFDTVQGYNESDLDEWTRSFCDSNPKGYGYFAWKSYVCMKTLERIEDDDVVVYADAGCMLNPRAKGRITEYFDMVKAESGILGFQMTWLEREWNKMELLSKFRCESRSDILDVGQIGAAAFVFRKCPNVCSLISDWNSIPKENPIYINDTNTMVQLPSFKEHRCDQSILSLLMKTRGAIILGWEPCCLDKTIDVYGNSPIWEARLGPAINGVNHCRFFNPLLPYRKNVHSQNGEDGVIQEILRRLDITTGWACEYGAWDGKHLSNTFALVERGWNVVMIEGDMAKVNDLYKTVAEYPNIVPIGSFVEITGVNSIDNILNRTKIPTDFDILSSDIDSYDYEVWREMKLYNPKIVIIEINSGADASDKNHTHTTTNAGTGFRPMLELAESKGYTFLCHTGNMIFIRNDLFDQLGIIKPEPYANFINYSICEIMKF